MTFQERIRQYKWHRILSILKNTAPEKFEEIGRKKRLKILRSALQNAPAYHNHLQHNTPHLLQKAINQITWEELPPLSKENYFQHYSLAELAGKRSKKIKLAMTSSGFSGKFAFGFSTAAAYKSFKLGLDTSFEYCFNISEKRTFLINCEPMGVHIETSLPMAETSVRSDMAIALLKKVSPLYDQTVLIGDPYFMKKLVEDGDDAGIDWVKLNVSLVTGQDWLPESLRSYLAERLHINFDDPKNERTILTTMGMTEIGINVFHESDYLIKLRRKVASDPNFKDILVNSEFKAPPMFYHYYPFRTFIETQMVEQEPEMLFTSLDKDAIVPIIRYGTGDNGTTLSYQELSNLLQKDYPELIPDLKLPIGIIFGRSGNRFTTSLGNFRLEEVKEALYLNKQVAESVTGLLKIETKHEIPKVHIHLKKAVKPHKSLQSAVENALNSYLQMDIRSIIHSYTDFPDALELSYEHKLYRKS